MNDDKSRYSVKKVKVGVFGAVGVMYVWMLNDNAKIYVAFVYICTYIAIFKEKRVL